MLQVQRHRIELPRLMVTLGYVTIGAQVLLLREFFSVLHGSDLSVAFVLAAWTLFSGMGAWSFTRFGRRLPGRPQIGLIAYTVLVLFVFLAVRRWGSQDLITFAHYGRIPLYLCFPCFLGGALFAWGVRRGCESRHEAAAQAYANETFGGLMAGLLMTAYFRFGGLSIPALLSLTVLTLLLAVAPYRSWLRSKWSVPLLALLLLVVARTPSGTILEHWSLRLRFPDCQVLAHRNTPHGSLTAVQCAQSTFVFENGLPVATPLVTPSKEALAALPACWSTGFDRILAISAISHGFGPLLSWYQSEHIECWERDAAKLDFLDDWHKAAGQPGRVRVAVSSSPWQSGAGPYDLVVHYASPPESLVANNELTYEFFSRAREHLDDGGVYVVLLPMAPGFMHPLQKRYLLSTESALNQVFEQTKRIETELGFVLLVAARGKPVLDVSAERLARRFQPLHIETKAEVERVLARALAPPLLGLPPEVSPAPVNSVARPYAYFAYLHFRGAMIENASMHWRTVFKAQPLWLAAGLVLGFCVLAFAAQSKIRGAAPLFWCSWTATMTLVFSLYLYQSIVGQAYLLVAFLIAASMCGVYQGAKGAALKARHWLIESAPMLLLALLFPSLERLQALPDTAVLLVLLAVNMSVGWSLGTRFAKSNRQAKDDQGGTGKLFCVDLLGASGGLFLGGVVLAWWSGFQNAALLCTAATAATLGVEQCRR